MKFQTFHLNKIIFLIFAFLCLSFTLEVEALVKPTKDFYVNDYANILSNEVEEYIKEKSVALNKVDGTQIVVVTIPSLEGQALEDYANQLFRSFGIGDKDKNNGLLLLLALEEREFRVEVGYGLEGILPDGKTGRFQDTYIIPYLKNDEFDQGIKNGYDAFYSEIVKLNNLDLDYTEPTSEEDTDEGYILFIVLTIILIFFLISIFTNHWGSYYHGGHYHGGSSGGGFSSGGFSGGGGSSLGGGSSRNF